MDIVTRKSATLKPAPWNVRKDHDLQGIAESIRVNEFRDPIEVWAVKDGKRIEESHQIVAGEGRWRAAVEVLGLAEVPVIEHEFADLDAAKRYSIANNRLTDKSVFDEPRLLEQLEALPELDGTGFDLEDLAELRGEDGTNPLRTDPDEVPEAPVDPITKLGDVWVMGGHRLLCGDSTTEAAVAVLMGDERAEMVFTDPPYGVQYQGKGGASIAGDISYTAIPLFFANVGAALAPQAWVYVCGGNATADLYSRMFERYFHQTLRVLLWDKGQLVLRHNGYHSACELIYYGFTEGCGDRWYGSRAGEGATDVWRVPKPTNSERLHLTEKPVELPRRAITNSCAPGGLVFEPFCGTGSTIIAAEQLGRRCYAIEIEPKYCDVAVRRWMNATGGQAVREQDGFEFPKGGDDASEQPT